MIVSVRPSKITVGKPALEADEISIRMELDVDEGWFLDGSATVTATVPAPDPQAAAIPAQVDQPVRGRAKSAAAQVVQHP